MDPAEEFPPSALPVAEEYLQRHPPLYTEVWTCELADEYPFHTDWPTDCGNSPRPYALGGVPSAGQMTSASPPSFSYGGAPIFRPIRLSRSCCVDPDVSGVDLGEPWQHVVP